MAEIGYGYGSEWHLMRFMARHRKCLERAICEKLDDEESKFVWLDFDFANKTDSSITGDVEIKGLSFLQSDEIKDHLSNELLDKIKKEYIIGWENTQSWDAIFLKGNTIFLVEAKAHRDELKSGNDIHGGKSHKEIKSFIGRQFSSLGINENDEWLKNYYQFANRLATTIFLKKHLNDINLDVKLLYIYFVNGYLKKIKEGNVLYPTINKNTNKRRFKQAIKKEKEILGLKDVPLNDYLVELFIDAETGNIEL